MTTCHQLKCLLSPHWDVCFQVGWAGQVCGGCCTLRSPCRSGVGIWQGAERLILETQKKHPTWASQSSGFMDDAKSPKLAVSAQGVLGCPPPSLEQKPHLERTGVWPTQEEGSSADQAVSTPSPCPSSSHSSPGNFPTPQTHCQCRTAQPGVTFVWNQPT